MSTRKKNTKTDQERIDRLVISEGGDDSAWEAPIAIKRSKPAPKASRPKMAKGYGVPKDSRGLLPWSHVDECMAAARNYWVATTRPDGRPHVMPVWGVWIEGVLYFGTDRSSRKSRNLATNPTVVVHLESGDEVVIVEGVAQEMSALTSDIDNAYLSKYGMRLRDAPGDLVVYAVSPRTVFAWQESTFPKSVTKWEI